MSGRNAQDPVFGSDVVWDDFQMSYQKIFPTTFPMERRILKGTEPLLPTYLNIHYAKGEERPPDSHVDESGDQTYLYWVAWQRRPVQAERGSDL